MACVPLQLAVGQLRRRSFVRRRRQSDRRNVNVHCECGASVGVRSGLDFLPSQTPSFPPSYLLLPRQNAQACHCCTAPCSHPHPSMFVDLWLPPPWPRSWQLDVRHHSIKVVLLEGHDQSVSAKTLNMTNTEAMPIPASH